jgi:hypothetical protein
MRTMQTTYAIHPNSAEAIAVAKQPCSWLPAADERRLGHALPLAERSAR